MMGFDSRPYWKPHDLAALFDVSPSRVHRLIGDGELKHRRIGERAIRIPARAVAGLRGEEAPVVSPTTEGPAADLAERADRLFERTGWRPKEFVEAWRGGRIGDTDENAREAIEAAALSDLLFHVPKHETMFNMLKGQDVVVLLKLLGRAEPVGARELAKELGFDAAGAHRALRRLSDAGLYSSERRRVFGAPAEEFLVHAVKFSFPAKRGTEVRGIPTSWAAEPLKGELAESAALPPVWPHSKATVRGLSFEPLHPMVPGAAKADPQLWERLSLVDALRSNESARIVALAARLLKERIQA